MEFDCRGTRYRFTFGFFTVLALYMLFDRSGMGLPVLAAVALHEGGHILVMHLTDAQIPVMQFCPFGVRLECRGALSIGREAAVYLGGIIANIAALLLTWLFCGWNLFALINLSLFLFNLLPIGRLDGGALLGLLLGRRLPFQQAEHIRLIVGFLVLMPIFAAAFYLLLQGNCTLLVTACYLAITLFCS